MRHLILISPLLVMLTACNTFGTAEIKPVVLIKPLLPVSSQAKIACEVPEFEAGSSKIKLIETMADTIEECEQKRAELFAVIELENSGRRDFNKSLVSSRRK